MSSVQNTIHSSTPPPERRKTYGQGAAIAGEFAAVFAQFARQTSRDAGAAGRLSLSIGRSGGGAAEPSSLAQTTQPSPGEGSDARAGAESPNRGPAEDAAATAQAAGPRGARTHATASARDTAGPAHAAPSDPRPLRGQTPRANHDNATVTGAPSGARSTPSIAAAPAATVGLAAGAGQTISAPAAAARGGPAAVSNTAGAPMLGSGSDRGAALRTLRATPAPTPAAPHPRNPAEVFRAQALQGLSAALRQGRGDVTLKLRPETLGELRVRLSVRGSEVEARIRASTVEAHRLLEQSVESLRSALEARGLHAGRIEIEPVAQTPRHNAEHAPHGAQPENAGPGPGEERRDDGARDAPERASGGGAAGFVGDSQDDESEDAWTPGASDAPGVVYSGPDGAARVVMIDALA